MIHIAFQLSMPGRSSWNGKWSGEERLYVIVRSFRNQSREQASAIVDPQNYGYPFGDGWFANVSVSEVNEKEAKRLKKQSDGFCGYDWMVDSIISNGNIITRSTSRASS